MTADSKLIERAAREMIRAYENGDESSTQKNAEAIMNLLVGSQSQEHKDWNGDGQTTDAGSGYGFMLNADNLGYIQAIYSHADYVANSPGGSQNMIVNGERCEDLCPKSRTVGSTIARSSFDNSHL